MNDHIECKVCGKELEDGDDFNSEKCIACEKHGYNYEKANVIAGETSINSSYNINAAATAPSPESIIISRGRKATRGFYWFMAVLVMLLFIGNPSKENFLKLVLPMVFLGSGLYSKRKNNTDTNIEANTYKLTKSNLYYILLCTLILPLTIGLKWKVDRPIHDNAEFVLVMLMFAFAGSALGSISLLTYRLFKNNNARVS